MLVVHKWLKDFLGDATPSVEEIEKLLTFHSFEIEGTEEKGEQEVIDIDVLPNRSSDCLSHRGIAREIAALIDVSLTKDPFTAAPELTPHTEKVTVTIEDKNACRRFGAALVTGLTVKESPDWLKERLIAIGQRPINNIVDATNYVMFALGQPLHAYDADKFETKNSVWQFGVRDAREGEKITTLSDDEYKLNKGISLITNAATDTPAGIAGIKGGKYAEVNSDTTAVIIEAANFDAALTRRSSQRLKLQTDASKRFENAVSPSIVPYALQEIVALLNDIAGGVAEGYVDVYPNSVTNPTVAVRLSQINSVLGLSLTDEDVIKILKRLGFEVTKIADGFNVVAPIERTDVHIPEDVIEEVGRVYGYSHVASVIPERVELSEINARQFYSERIRAAVCECGFSEVITSSFRKKDAIRLKNALASDKGCLRSSLAENIREVLDKNIQNVDLLGTQDIRVFEIGTVFTKGDRGVAEHISVAFGVRTKKQGYSQSDDVILRETLAHLEEMLGTIIEHDIKDGILEYSLSDLLTKLPIPKEYTPFDVTPEITYKPFSTYPFVSRDIALWVPEETSASEVMEVIDTNAGTLRVRTTLFDEFKKDGKVSYAFRLVFQSQKKTLTDSEVNAIMDGITTATDERGWTVR